MTTAAEIVTRAYRKIGVGAVGETITAAMQDEGLAALNMMVAAWALDGVDTLSPTMVAATTFPLEKAYEEGTVYMLAARLSPDYSAPASFDPEQWMRRFRAAYMTIEPATIAGPLLRLPSQKRRYGGF